MKAGLHSGQAASLSTFVPKDKQPLALTPTAGLILQFLDCGRKLEEKTTQGELASIGFMHLFCKYFTKVLHRQARETLKPPVLFPHPNQQCSFETRLPALIDLVFKMSDVVYQEATVSMHMYRKHCHVAAVSAIALGESNINSSENC